MKPTFAELSAALSYDPDTGALTWRHNPNRHARWNARWAGKPAGTTDARGRTTIYFQYRKLQVSHVVWLLMTGQWPEADVDHKDRDPTNNKWDNLRAATRSQNLVNRNGWGKYAKGVRKNRGRFRAMIKIHGKETHLGSFATEAEAHEAYLRKARELWGEFAG